MSEDPAADALERVAAFHHAARTHFNNQVLLTGIDPTWLAQVDTHLHHVTTRVMKQIATDARGGTARPIDYELRQQPNPLQPYLDRLQRRHR
jgi:hypothetical protein